MWLERMLTVGPARDNDGVAHDVRERLDDVRPLLAVRRIGSVTAMVVAITALAGLVPLSPGTIAVLFIGAVATETERAIVLRSRSAAAIDRLLTAFAVTYVLLAVALLHLAADVLWIGLLFFALTLVASATVMSLRALVAVTLVASLAFSGYLLAAGAGLLQFATGGTVDGTASRAVQYDGLYTPIAIVLIGGFGFPALAAVVYAGTRRLRGTRDELRRTANDLQTAEQHVAESQEQLRQWAVMLRAEVVSKTAELEQRNHYLEAINTISSALGGPMDDEGTTERTCRLVARVLDARATQLFVLPAGEQQSMHQLVNATPDDDEDPPPLDHVMMEQVAKDGEPIFHGNGESDAHERFAVVPLVAKGRGIGSFAVLGAAAGDWDEHMRSLLVLVGREMGVALENGRLYRDALIAAAKENALAEAQRIAGDEELDAARAFRRAMRLMADQLGAQMAVVVMHPETELQPQTVARYFRDHALSTSDSVRRALFAAPSLAADRSRPLVLGTGGEGPVSATLAAEGIATFVLAPIVRVRAGGPAAPEGVRSKQRLRWAATVGTLVVAAGPDVEWRQRDIDLLAGLAGALARRLETDDLLQLQERRIRELSGLAEIATMAQSTVDTDRLYSGFARALERLVDYQHLFMVRFDDVGELAHVVPFGPGGRALPAPALDRADSRHPWFGRRSIELWRRDSTQLPSFVGPDHQQGVIVPLRPKGQVLGVVIVVTNETLAPDQRALLGQAAEQLALAIDSAALYRQATERAARIQVLSHLARIVASVADLREAFGAFVDEVRWLIPFDGAVMMLVDEDADTVELYAAYPAERDDGARPVPLPGSLARVVIDAGGPIALARNDPRFAQLDWSGFEPDVQEVAAVPVMHGAVCTAVFALARDSGQSYVVEEFMALEEVAGLLAVTIERLRLYERAEYDARHDLLTGLPNLRYLNEHLESLQPALKDGGRAAVFMIDLDRLKIFNDTLGHESGDRVIRIAAREIRAAARAEDFVARVGGDEFVVVMADADLEVAVTVAERMHNVLWEAHAEIPSAPARLGISAGIAVAPDDGDDPTHLLNVADRAMYEAKFAGGGRTRLAGERQDPTPARFPGVSAGRVVEALVGAATAGASGGELAALAFAERLALATALRLGVPAEATPPLRLLVAAIAAKRLSEPQENIDQGTALMLIDGLHREWTERAPQHAAVGLALVPAAVALAWQLAEPPVGAGASLEAAARQLHEQPPDGSTPEAIDALEAVARPDAVERRGDEGRAA